MQYRTLGRTGTSVSTVSMGTWQSFDVRGAKAIKHVSQLVTEALRYVVATQDTEAVKAFGEAMQRHAAGSGGEIMTYAQELLQEGERKGKQEGERKGKIKGQIETIENFLKAGVGWAVIESATGIDEKQLAALKQQLAEMTH